MARISEGQIAKQIEQKLVDLVIELDFVKLTDVQREVPLGLPSARMDIIADVRISGRPRRLIFEVKATGEPQAVRLAASQLRSYVEANPGAYGVFAAPFISDRGRRVCREMGIGCMDLAGNAWLSFDQVFIDRSGHPSVWPERRPLKSLFSPKSSRVSRVLLADPSKGWLLKRVSEEAGVSLGLASKVKQALTAEEWIESGDDGMVLTKPEELLREWAANYDYRKNEVLSYYTERRLREFEQELARVCETTGTRYALAMFSAASRVAPFVESPRAFAYVDSEVIETVVGQLGLKRVGTGPNAVLLRPYDEGVFYGLQGSSGLKMTSNIQTYLDLASYRGRGEEAAQVLLDQRIRPDWGTHDKP